VQSVVGSFGSTLDPAALKALILALRPTPVTLLDFLQNDEIEWARLRQSLFRFT
jgi:hypothetical protein